MKTYDLDLHLFKKVNKPYLTFCGAICAPCFSTYKLESWKTRTISCTYVVQVHNATSMSIIFKLKNLSF